MNRKPIYNLFIWCLKRFNLSMKTIDTWHVYLVFHVAKLKWKFLAELRSPWKVTLKILNLKAKKIWFLSLPTTDTHLQGKPSHEQGRKMASKRRTLGKINVVCWGSAGCGLRAAFLLVPHRGKSLRPKRRRKTGGAVEVQAQGIKIIINCKQNLNLIPTKKEFYILISYLLKKIC